MADVTFEPGSFREYRATTKIHLGKIQADVSEGQTVFFDGQVLRMGKVEHDYPEFGASVRVGWFVPVSDNVSAYKPKPAGVSVRSAQGNGSSGTDVSEDDTFVGSAVQPKPVEAKAEPRKPGQKFEVKREEDVGIDVAPALPSKSEKQASSGMDGLNEGAVSVGKIGVPASTKTVVSDASAASRIVSNLDNKPRKSLVATKTDVHAASADKVEDIISVLEPEGKAAALGEVRSKQADKAKPKKAMPNGNSAKVESDAPPEPTKPVKVEGPPQTIEEIVLRDGLVEVYPGVKWDKSLHWRARVKIALDEYGDRPEVIEAIKKIEAPAVVKFIENNAGRKSF